MDEQLIGACGIFCGACDHYLSTTPQGKHLLNGGGPTAGKLGAHPCGGCGCRDEARICVYCRDCVIRLCALRRGHGTCARCGDFPCEETAPFRDSEFEHKKEAFAALYRNKGLDTAGWLALCQRRWSCPACGTPHGYYETTCNTCGEGLDHLFPDRR